MIRDKIIVIVVALLAWSYAVICIAQETQSSGLVEYTVTSKIAHQDYRLFVVAPEDYSQAGDEAYDVVYVLDINSEDSAQLVQFQRSISQLPNVPNFILVGVGFSPDEEHRGLRTAHFSPTQDEAIDEEILAILQGQADTQNVGKWQSGGAREFVAVMESELLPFLNENYRTSGNDTIMGASLAGLFLTVVLFENPELFENYIITSPSVWWNDFELFSDRATYALGRDDLFANVYLSVGGLENSQMLESYERLQSAFGQNGSENLKFSAERIENQTHLSVIPISYANGLQYVFSASD